MLQAAPFSSSGSAGVLMGDYCWRLVVGSLVLAGLELRPFVKFVFEGADSNTR